MKQRWLVAVVVSVAFHLSLFLGVRAVIRAVVPSVAQVSVVVQAGDEPRPVEIIRVGVRSRTAPARPPAPATPAPATPAPLPHGARRPAGDGPVTEPFARATGGEPATEPISERAVAATEPGAEAPAAGRPSFGALIHDRLARGAARCYPAAAQRFRQRGEVTMAFCVGALGEPEQISVDLTSGSALLDDAARECVVPAAAPLPLEATGQCFRVPVRFGQ